MSSSNERLKMLILTAMFAAITGILAQIVIPLPPVPISGQTLAVGLTATILGSRWGALVMILYAVLGGIGVPVFTGGSAGVGILVGPTGGYIFGFIIGALIIGFILEKIGFSFPKAIVANLIGSMVILTAGTVQLKFVSALSWHEAFAFGVYPFIIGGVMKSILAAWVGIAVRKRLVSARLINAPGSGYGL